MINLARSKRWIQTKERLDKKNLVYSRFEAIDRDNISINDLETHNTILGKYAQDHKILMSKHKKYEINCTPDSPTPVKFLLHHRVLDFHPGEAALWCSNIMIWQDAIAHNYQNIIVFEDDVLPIGRHFKIWLNNYVHALPKSYDLAFLGATVFSPKTKKIPDNAYITKFDKEYGATGAFGMVYSARGMKKLLSVDYIDHHLDMFFQDHMIVDDAKSEDRFLEIYGSYNDRFRDPPPTKS